MKNIFKNKLLIILVLISLFITTICSSVFAESGDLTFTYNNTDYTISSDIASKYPYILILEDTINTQQTRYNCFFSTSPFTYTLISTDSSWNYYRISSSNLYVQLIDPSSNLSSINSFSSSDLFYCANGYYSSETSKHFPLGVPYSSHNVYDSNDELVFQGAPQVQVAQVELMKATQVQEILPQIIAVVKIVLPIFLGIFGVLLMLYLIKSKNLLQL